MAPRTRVALVAFAGALVCGEVAVRLAPSGDARDAVGLLTSTLAMHLGLGLLVVGIAFLLGGADPRDRLGLRAGRLGARGIAWAVAGTVALSHAVHRVLALLSLRDQGALAVVDQAVASAAERPETLALAVAALALLPPLTEELLFRGLVLRGLLRRVPPLVAVGGSAALFGAFHLEPIHAGAATVLGLYLGAVAWRADSVRPAMAAHLVNNGLGVVGAAALGGAGADATRPPSGEAAVAASVAVILVLGAFAALALRRVWRTSPAPASLGRFDEPASDGAGPEPSFPPFRADPDTGVRRSRGTVERTMRIGASPEGFRGRTADPRSRRW